MTIEARPVVKNKYWIVERNGEKIGTIQASVDGVVLVEGERRKKYPSIKVLGTAHSIRFARGRNPKRLSALTVYDYPARERAYNAIYDLRLRLPLYTASKKSKSYFCAGYYLINLGSHWMLEFCPKKIILTRNKFLGPFKSEDRAREKLTEIMPLSTYK